MKRNMKVSIVLFLVIIMMLTGCSGSTEDGKIENAGSSGVSEKSSVEDSTKEEEGEDSSVKVLPKKKEIKDRTADADAKKKVFDELAETSEELHDADADFVSQDARLHNIKEYFFKQKDDDVLTEDTTVMVFFVDDVTSKWNESDVNVLKNSLEKGNQHLLKEANRYGIDFDVQLEYVSCEVDISIYDVPFVEALDAVLEASNIPRQEVLKKPRIFALNDAGRSYAASIWDFVVLYAQEPEVETTYVHELLHLYGAADYYYNDTMLNLANKYLTNSIYAEGKEVDSFAAHLVGWLPELTVEAESFLEELASDLSSEELTESKKLDMKSGNVTDYEFGGGVYTGEVKSGSPHGYGKMVWNFEGVIVEYEGEWKNGYQNGQGTMTYSDGYVEKGIWKDGALVEPN